MLRLQRLSPMAHAGNPLLLLEGGGVDHPQRERQCPVAHADRVAVLKNQPVADRIAIMKRPGHSSIFRSTAALRLLRLRASMQPL